MCHCLECQRRTGSIFGVQARYPRENVQVIGPSTKYARAGDSGGVATFHFCPTCGSTVFWELDGLPGFVAVAVGGFAEPSFPAPVISVYEDRMHGWLELPAGIEHMR